MNWVHNENTSTYFRYIRYVKIRIERERYWFNAYSLLNSYSLNIYFYIHIYIYIRRGRDKNEMKCEITLY